MQWADDAGGRDNATAMVLQLGAGRTMSVAGRVRRVAPAPALVAPSPRPLLFMPGGDVERLRAASTLARWRGPGPSPRRSSPPASTCGRFVAVAWETDLRVMAFGDVDVETDQPSLPMLSGAGSRTWVEHTITAPSSGDGRGRRRGRRWRPATSRSGPCRPVGSGWSSSMARGTGRGCAESVEVDVPAELQAAVDADETLPPLDAAALLPPDLEVVAPVDPPCGLGQCCRTATPTHRPPPCARCAASCCRPGTAQWSVCAARASAGCSSTTAASWSSTRAC